MQFTFERLALLRLARTSGVGPVGLRRLLIRYGGAEAALADFSRWQRNSMTLATGESVSREVEALDALGGTLLLWGDEDYPPALAQLPDPPVALSLLGDVAAVNRRQVALVGNRNASAAGLTWARALAEALAAQRLVVTSGLARGIDTAAHEGAMLGGGQTVAVVAGGVDHIYPPENKRLREAIIANGAVVSEQPLGMVPTAQLFPRRNRVIAGLSVGVAVSEATRHSGSLITAQCALDYGREVWAVPGSPSDPRAAGPNWLLKNGATLVEGAADILANLPKTPAPYVPPAARAGAQMNLLEEMVLMPADGDDPHDDVAPVEIMGDLAPRTRVYGLLGTQAVGQDELLRACGLGEAELAGVLIEMELEGHAVREADGRWRRG